MASRLHSSYAHPVSRIWQSLESTLRPENLMYPLFIIDDPNEEQPIGKAFKIVSRYALKNAMYCHLKSYSCTSSGTRILPESRNLRKFPSTSAVH